MPRLEMPSGEKLDLAQDQFGQALGASGAPDGARVWVQRPNGTYTTIPATADQIATAQGMGYKLADEKVLAERDRQESYGQGLGNELKAGALGAARGATLGLSDPALAALHEVAPGIAPSKEELNLYREKNPMASGAGEAAGMVAPLLLSGGTAAGAEGASLGARVAGGVAGAVRNAGVIPRGIEAAAQAGTRALGGSLGAKIVARTLEGSVYGAMSSADTAYLRDQPIQDELLHGAGLGAMLGGGLALGGGLIEMAAGKVGARAAARSAGLPEELSPEMLAVEAKGLSPAELERRGLSKAEIDTVQSTPTGSTLPDAIQAKVGALASMERLAAEANPAMRAYSWLADKLGGPNRRDALSLLASGEGGAEARSLASHAEEKLDTMAREAAPVETGLNRVNDYVSRYSREDKAKAMGRLVTDVWDDKVAQGAWEQVSKLRGDMQDMLAQGRGTFDGLPQVKVLVDILKHREAQIGEAIDKQSMAGIFGSLDNAKRDLGSFAAKLYRGAKEQDLIPGQVLGSRIRKTAGEYERAYQELRETLQDPAKWGAAAAEAQTKINRAWTELLATISSNGKHLFKRYGRADEDLGRSAWESGYISDPADWRGFYNELSKPAGDVDYQIQQKLQSERLDLAMSHIDAYGLTEKAVWGEDALTAGKLKGLLGEELFRPGARFADLAGKSPEEILRGVTNRHIADLALAKKIKTLGDTLSRVQASPGGLMAYSPTRLVGPSAVLKAYKATDLVTGLARSAGASQYALISAARAFMGLGSVKATVPAASWQAGRASIKDKDLHEAIVNPHRLHDWAKQHLPPDAAAGASQMLDRVLASAPKPAPQYLYDQMRGQKHKLDAKAVQTWRRDVLSNAQDPSAIIGRMQDGTLTPQQVTAFKALYPALYQGLSRQFRVWMGQGKSELSSARLRSLSTFLGEPMTAKTNVAVSAAVQGIYQKQAAPKQQGPSARPRGVSEARTARLSKAAPMTQAEKLELNA